MTLTAQFELFVPGSPLNHRQGSVEQGVEVEWRFLQGEFSGVDLGQIEHGIDDFQEMMTGLLQRIQALFLQFAQAAATDQVGHAGDGIEWRTDFVTDVGQELAFRRAGLLGG